VKGTETPEAILNPKTAIPDVPQASQAQIEAAIRRRKSLRRLLAHHAGAACGLSAEDR
jgi:hypothetical protein